ncbi:hypothetical protein N7510_010587 [Penicillium lagena]|uniref:uncharacterized protein n=1 Tax=Penicillium lagena TaxID=94218 RepID=UPI002541B362|nr:uncharacterized protein N7510_010587 [Penicillium lagena]KAJ5601053.1 hypothetical protein N7510_010587 [Penicillium lagena]
MDCGFSLVYSVWAFPFSCPPESLSGANPKPPPQHGHMDGSVSVGTVPVLCLVQSALIKPVPKLQIPDEAIVSMYNRRALRASTVVSNPLDRFLALPPPGRSLSCPPSRRHGKSAPIGRTSRATGWSTAATLVSDERSSKTPVAESNHLLSSSLGRADHDLPGSAAQTNPPLSTVLGNQRLIVPTAKQAGHCPTFRMRPVRPWAAD